MKNMKKKLATLVAAVTASAMVFGTGLTANAAGDQSQHGKEVPIGTTPCGVFVYGCYYTYYEMYPEYTTDFPVEYLTAIDAAGITNEMSDYEKCVCINDYLCRTVEYGSGETYGGGCGLDLLQYGKGICSGYADAFQTMTSMLGIKSYMYISHNLNHDWNAVDIDGVRYFVDVTWNDSLNCNNYLMSTELWDDHKASDIEIKGASSNGWEVRQVEDQAKMQQHETEMEMLNNNILDFIENTMLTDEYMTADTEFVTLDQNEFLELMRLLNF